MKRVISTCLTLCLSAALALPASALDYSIDAPGNPDYRDPTSIEVVHTADGGAMKNEDISKNAALIPPSFGSPSADALGTGTYLTPNLAPGGMAVGTISGGNMPIVFPPTSGEDTGNTSSGSSGGSSTSGGYTYVTDDLYYSGGYLGTLKISAIGLSVKIYQGTGSSTLAKGAGHFTDTSIWDGTVALAGHNRGVNNHFGKIHTLEIGDKITLTTKLGTRTYKVTSVSKVSETDRSAMTPTGEDRIVLYTCVMNQSAYPDAVIVQEVFTRTRLDRPEWLKLMRRIQPGDEIVFDSVSRMSGDAKEGFAAYEELYQKGVNLVYLKEPHINTETYKKALENNIQLTGSNVDYILEGVNRYLLELAKEQIRLAFEQSEKEVQDLHQRTREGIETARLNGKQIGRQKNSVIVTRKSIESKEVIRKLSKEFDGNLSDAEIIRLTGLARNTYYKYKRELRNENKEMVATK